VKSAPSASDFALLASPDWVDYELVDSGSGLKLERYGPYTFVRPEPQAMWRPALKEAQWKAAHAVFQPTGEESGGRWQFNKPVEPTWEMGYKGLKFRAQATAARHLGVFPEQASHWDWSARLIESARRPVQVLNLFGYTGLATMAAARAGARVTHVDASKKSVTWARENQALSRLENHSIRWIVDDALKFVEREGRRQMKYDGLILDPPKFGRGPKGEVWEFFELMPRLLDACKLVLSDRPLFVVVTAYAIRSSALSLHFTLQEMLKGLDGKFTSGELTLVEHSAGRRISTAIFTRWEGHPER
jgi:23S rRNA (cytosine1962-C5)-methyltransferase